MEDTSVPVTLRRLRVILEQCATVSGPNTAVGVDTTLRAAAARPP
jgi:hypothetical protein